jgi:hypothetical protein
VARSRHRAVRWLGVVRVCGCDGRGRRVGAAGSAARSGALGRRSRCDHRRGRGHGGDRRARTRARRVATHEVGALGGGVPSAADATGRGSVDVRRNCSERRRHARAVGVLDHGSRRQLAAGDRDGDRRGRVLGLAPLGLGLGSRYRKAYLSTGGWIRRPLPPIPLSPSVLVLPGGVGVSVAGQF